MKIRMGFVSNSSAASFCIYGWHEEMLGDLTCWQMYDLIKYIRNNNKDISIVDSNSQSYEMIFGVGNSETDIDHWYNEYFESGYNENWEDYKSEPPTKEEMERLDEIAKELGLPNPEIFSDTWFDG